MTTHKRALLTSDCLRHAVTDSVPCWCGATDAKPRGLNVLSSEVWTPGSIAGLIAWLGTELVATS
jgi:hypothetical protein